MATTLPQGWTEYGNNLVKNTQTGQVLSTSMDAWKKIQGTTTPQTGGIDPVPTPGGGTPGTSGSLQQQSQNAQTYSQTPGAAPKDNTTNQGAQDVVRNSYLQRATQGTQIDANDPNIRQQLDPFAAATERARRQYESEQAERLSARGLGQSSQMDTERRMASERAGEQVGLKASDLVSRELDNRRTEIREALSSLSGLLSQDQQRALQEELARLEAQLKQQQIKDAKSIADRELGLKRELGLGGLNIDQMRLLLQNQQFNKDLGFNIADREAYYNNAALQSLLR